MKVVMVIFVFAACTLTVVAQDRPERMVRRELKAKYAAIVDAYRKRDIRAFMEDKTSKFTVKSIAGSVASRAEVEIAVKARMERIDKLNYLEIRIKSITVTRDVAVAITAQEFSRVTTDASGRKHTVTTTGTTHRDAWVRTESGWKMERVEELTQGTEIVDDQG